MFLHLEVPQPRLRIWRDEDAVHLPRLVLIADRFTTRDVAHATVAAAQAGVEWVHLRDHTVTDPVFWEVGRNLIGRIRRVNERILISVDSRVRYAAEWLCGVHTGAHGPPLPKTRESGPINGPVGYSAHSLDVARAAHLAGSDYLFFSPIFETPMKPWAPAKGMDGLRQVCMALPKAAVYALGGIRHWHVADCIAAGASGVAVVSAVLSAEDPARAVAEFQQAVADANGIG